MLDMDAIWKAQNEGSADIGALPQPEKENLQMYCDLATRGVINEGLKRKASMRDVVINAYRYGVALGLRLQVDAGAVKLR